MGAEALLGRLLNAFVTFRVEGASGQRVHQHVRSELTRTNRITAAFQDINFRVSPK